MDDNFGRMILDGKLLDLNKASDSELQNAIKFLQDEQDKKKNKLKNILEKMSEDM